MPPALSRSVALFVQIMHLNMLVHACTINNNIILTSIHYAIVIYNWARSTHHYLVWIECACSEVRQNIQVLQLSEALHMGLWCGKAMQ